jgi:hypothetical protein
LYNIRCMRVAGKNRGRTFHAIMGLWVWFVMQSHP